MSMLPNQLHLSLTVTLITLVTSTIVFPLEKEERNSKFCTLIAIRNGEAKLPKGLFNKVVHFIIARTCDNFQTINKFNLTF